MGQGGVRVTREYSPQATPWPLFIDRMQYLRSAWWLTESWASFRIQLERDFPPLHAHARAVGSPGPRRRAVARRRARRGQGVLSGASGGPGHRRWSRIRAVAGRDLVRGRPVRDRPVDRRPPCPRGRHLTSSRMAALDRLRGRRVRRVVCGGGQRRRVRCAGRISHLSAAPDGWQRAHGAVIGERTPDAAGDDRARWRAGRVRHQRLAGAALGAVRGSEPRLRQVDRGGRHRLDDRRTSGVRGALGDAAGSSHRRERALGAGVVVVAARCHSQRAALGSVHGCRPDGFRAHRSSTDRAAGRRASRVGPAARAAPRSPSSTERRPGRSGVGGRPLDQSLRQSL